MLARFLTIKLLSWSVPADLHGIDAYAHIFAYNELSWGLLPRHLPFKKAHVEL